MKFVVIFLFLSIQNIYGQKFCNHLFYPKPELNYYKCDLNIDYWYETLRLSDDSTFVLNTDNSLICTGNTIETKGKYMKNGDTLVLNSFDTTDLNAAINLKLLILKKDESHFFDTKHIFCNHFNTQLLFLESKNLNHVTFRNKKEEN